MTITSGPDAPAPARLRPGDLAGLASVGLRTRKLRAALSALGIAIGVAAIVAVLGLANSSQAALLAEISRLGTNLLTVSNGTDLTGQAAKLPDAAPSMIGRLPGVIGVQYTGTISSASVYRQHRGQPPITGRTRTQGTACGCAGSSALSTRCSATVSSAIPMWSVWSSGHTFCSRMLVTAGPDRNADV
jgi:hypothetical protein